MKIAVPIQHGRFCSHFGGADAFAIFPVDAATRTPTDPQFGSPPEHGRGVYPSWLRRQGATVVLAGGMGPRAIEIFDRQGIEVVLGVNGSDPEAMVRSYLKGTLESTGEVCHDNGFHDCGHGHGQGQGHGRQGVGGGVGRRH